MIRWAYTSTKRLLGRERYGPGLPFEKEATFANSNQSLSGLRFEKLIRL